MNDIVKIEPTQITPLFHFDLKSGMMEFSGRSLPSTPQKFYHPILEEIETAFEKQGYVGDKSMSEIKIICKLFHPVLGFYWYLYEQDQEEEGVYYAFVNLNDPLCSECGPISMEEIKSVNRMGSVERDKFFPTGKYTLKEVYDKVKAGGHV